MSARQRTSEGGFLRRNGLFLVAILLFALSYTGQILTGWREYAAEQREHRQPEPTLAGYLGSAHLGEATFENWESEFLQMGLFVVLTAYLRQKGSSESKALDGPDEVDEDPRKHRRDRNAPWPVRRGGLALILYEHSLSTALFLLFFASFAMHAVTGAREASQDEVAHGGHAITSWEYLQTPRFWFESFQNWQSEFLSVAVLVLLSIWLRDHRSPQSKPVHAPHGQTGGG